MATTYTNPIIPGCAPDPSIVRVDDMYYVVNSSLHVSPGLPIYASKNLRTWTLIGHAINRPSQLSLETAFTIKTRAENRDLVGIGGLYAPTIRHHGGKFYIICTNVSVVSGPKIISQNFYITTDDIWSDEWSDPVNFDWDGIDPSLFFDDDGRAYIQGQWNINPRPIQPVGTIKQAELNLATGTLMSNPREIWTGLARVETESPHVYKKDGWYYLLVAEGGTFMNHMLNVARSRDIWGPYESYDQNPILTATGKDEYIQNVGHGDMFQDSDGQWWVVILGIREDKSGRNTLGRETFLTPVHWPEDGWPSVSQPKVEMSRDSRVLALPNLDFSREPKLDLVYLRDPVRENYDISEDCKTFKLVASKTDFAATRSGTCTFVGKRQRFLNTFVTATLVIPAVTHGNDTLYAGLALFKDDHRHAEIYFSASSSKVTVMWTNFRTGETIVEDSKEEITASKVDFKIEAIEEAYTFFYRTSDQPWKKAGEVDTLDLTSLDFYGPVFGLFAFGKGKVRFEDVDLGEW